MLSGKDHGTTGRTDGVGHEAPIETDAFICQPIDIRRGSYLSKSSTVCANRIAGMIIGHDEQDIWALALGVGDMSDQQPKT